ncbi:uncharacterized protein LOC133923134 [Phragmites australis]|uniref:uncharacterized protein LOC133923134 n=1 Tax=Phragmites australis TaxID=29695 RepID=UPI002D77E79F|nr:uncharacterized protein LOC133923134 [Phragmites australis]
MVKIIETLCLARVLTIALYTGPSMSPVNHHHAFMSSGHQETSSSSSNGTWIKGVFQVRRLKVYGQTLNWSIQLGIVPPVVAVYSASRLIHLHLRRRGLAWHNASPLPRTYSALTTSTSGVAVRLGTVRRRSHEALASMPPFYYAHGVMHAPNSKDLLLAIPKLEATVWRWSPVQCPLSTSSSEHSDHFMCISNPVYEWRGQMPVATNGDTPLFKTPSESLSPFGIIEEDEEGEFSPPLLAMRKLPPLDVAACPLPTLSFVDDRSSLKVTDGRPCEPFFKGSVTDTNRASSSSSNLTAHFFSSW